jgi:hypothetical protein
MSANSFFKQPGWDHVFAAFVAGAREARANPEADETVFGRAADAYTKLIFSEVDPETHRRIGENDWPQPEPSDAEVEFARGIDAAARFVEKRLADYDAAHGSTDPDTGAREYPGTGDEYVCELAEIAEAIRGLAPPPAAPQPEAPSGWIACDERMPEAGVEVLVWLASPAFKGGSHVVMDTWDEQHEAPVAWSSATLPIGMGWDSGTDWERITHWMPLPAAPGAAPPQPADAEYEIRHDGQRVRRDRWELGFRRIVSIVVGNRADFDIDAIVARVADKFDRRAAAPPPPAEPVVTDEMVEAALNVKVEDKDGLLGPDWRRVLMRAALVAAMGVRNG